MNQVGPLKNATIQKLDDAINLLTKRFDNVDDQFKQANDKFNIISIHIAQLQQTNEKFDQTLIKQNNRENDNNLQQIYNKLNDTQVLLKELTDCVKQQK